MKTYVISAAIVAVSVLYFDLGISQIANAELPKPRAYKVPVERTTKPNNHRDAMLIVVARKWQGKTTHKLIFVPRHGKFAGLAFS